MKQQLNIRVSEITRMKLDRLVKRSGEAPGDIISSAIARAYQTDVESARRFIGYSQLIEGGAYTEAELDAARKVGHVNAFQQSPFDVAKELQQNAPDGWRVACGGTSSHSYNPLPPIRADAATEPILMGFVRVRAGDPHHAIWLFKIA